MYESLLEVGTVLLYAAGSLLLTGVGLIAEYDSFLNATSGNLTMAVWFAFMGTVALVAGANLAYDKVLEPKLS
ncbi:hypothetical protein DMJ13_12745 [halophilic archaeon]|nr:hypothetical protein DMJ13_12745 [halophilic archaeon]